MSDRGFHDFYRATFRPVVRHLRRLGLAHEQDLEDVVQEAYAQAFRSWQSLRAPEAQVVWLLTIARRQWGRVLAKRGRLSPAPRAATDADIDLVVEQVARDLSPEDSLIRTTTLATLKAEIAAIGNVRQRQAVELFYLFDWDLPEVCAATGVNASTLTTWLSRFRQKARAALAATEKCAAAASTEGVSYVGFRENLG
jgi:RNA polymerase sigma-70 factor (ECF subfamily)